MIGELRAKRLARTLLVLGVVAAISVTALWAARPSASNDPLLAVLVALAAVGYAVVGYLIVTKQPRNAIGWLFFVTVLALALVGAGNAYVGFAHGTHLPGQRWAAWLNQVFVAALLQPIPLILLLFPDGRPPSRRWRPLAIALAVAIPLTVLGLALRPGSVGGEGGTFPNPTELPSAPWIASVLLTVSGILSLAGAFACVVALVVRFRRAREEERQQLRWIAFVGATAAVMLIGAIVSGEIDSEGFVNVVFFSLLAATLAIGIPLACVIAILKYRLYDIDVVINKTVVFGALAAFITAVYVAIVVGIGAIIGSSGKPNLGLSILATAVVAVAFQPVRERVQRFANRLVYGERATPYEVLAGFVRRVGGTYAAEEVLPRMARALAEGTGAERAGVWLRLGSELRPEAFWPEGDAPSSVEPLSLSDGQLPPLPGSSLSLPVRDRGELLGALSLTKRPGEAVTPAEQKLTADLAGQAGLVLRNVGLTEELLVRLEEIERSRARIVTAEEEERVRIEERIREGTRRELEAIGGELDELLQRAPDEQALAALAEIGERTTRALESLRDVARGIYPPLLADKGLPAALEAQARRAAVPVTVEVEEVGRLDRDVESTVYFCCTEAMRRAEHAGASSVRIGLRTDVRDVVFEVRADAALGDGLFDVQDRAAALDGTVEIRSDDAGVNVITGRIPIRKPEHVG